MRRWANKAAPDDPGAWVDVGNMWPTKLGTYEVADQYDAGTALTATGVLVASFRVGACFAGMTPSGTARCYVADSHLVGAKTTWEYASGALTDRTNGVGGIHQFCQYGNITIGVRDSATPSSTVASTGGNFAALGGGSPSADICIVQSSAVVLFSYHDGVTRYTDGWWASDIGDYSTWTPAASNEAANGRLLETGGAIMAACPFKGDVLAFKKGSFYRGHYVGRPLIWEWKLISDQVGCVSRYAVWPCGDLVIFLAYFDSTGGAVVYGYDGANLRILNPETTFGTSLSVVGEGPFVGYDPQNRRAWIAGGTFVGIAPVSYDIDTGRWGQLSSAISAGFVQGEYQAVQNVFSNNNGTFVPAFKVTANDVITVYAPAAPAAGSVAYVKSHKYGEPEADTFWTRAIATSPS